MSTTPPDEPDTSRMTSGDPLGEAAPPPPGGGGDGPGASPPPPPGPGPEGAGPAPPPRRLTRSRHDPLIAGVCGGAGRYFGVDPVLVRIAVVVLAFFGGAGALLYLAAVLLVPAGDEAAEALAPAAPPDRNRALAVVGVVALALVAGPILLAPVFVVGGLLFPIAFLVLAGLTVAWLATGNWPEREAGPIARATLLGVGILALLFVVALGAGWGAAIGGDDVVAALVLAAGVAILVGAFVRPVRWLVPVALALAIPAGFVAAAGIELDGGVGEKRFAPASTADLRDRYELGIGELVVDLRGVELEAGEEREVDLEVGMGHALLLVDEGVCVATRAEIGMGAVEVFHQENGGVDVDLEDLRTARRGAPRILVDGNVGLGLLEVDHVEDRDLDGWHDDEATAFDASPRDDGCLGAS